MPMHFFRMLQMLTSFLENMGAGRHVLGCPGVARTLQDYVIAKDNTSVNRETIFPSEHQFTAAVILEAKD